MSDVKRVYSILNSITLKVKDLLYQMGLIADYVVEQGSDDTWTYRKWNSGIAECWCKQSYTTTITTASGDLYRSAALTAPDYPTDLFTEIPIINMNSHGASGYFTWAGWANPGTIEYAQGFYLFRSSSLSTSYTFAVDFDVKGRWK